MSPLFDSGPHGLRTVRNPLISGTLQQRSKKLLVESDSHNRARPPPDWRAPGSRTGQLLKVVAGFSLVRPGLDLLVTHATSVEKVLTHGNIVYETRSQSLPLYRNTQQPVATTEPDNDPALCQPADASELLPAVDLRCPTRRRSASRRTCSLGSRAASRCPPHWPQLGRVLSAGLPQPNLRRDPAQRWPAGRGLTLSAGDDGGARHRQSCDRQREADLNRSDHRGIGTT